MESLPVGVLTAGRDKTRFTSRVFSPSTYGITIRSEEISRNDVNRNATRVLARVDFGPIFTVDDLLDSFVPGN